MKKKRVALIGLILFFVVLFWIYISLKGKEQSSEDIESEAENEKIEYILNWDEEKTQKISVFDKNGKKLNFFKENENWKLEKYEEKSLIKEEITSMIGYASAIESKRKIEHVEDLSEYGLDKPLNVIEREMEDGTIESFTIGMHSDATGCTYIYLNDEKDVVYAVSKNMGNLYKCDILDFIEHESYPTFFSDNVQKVEVKKADSCFSLMYDFSAATCWIVEDDVYGKKLGDKYAGDNLSSMVSVISYSEFYDYDCQDFSQYGLDEPQMEICVTYHETVDNETMERAFIIYVGDYDEDGNYYVRMNDSKEVHGIAKTHIEKLLGETVVDYWALNMSEVSLEDLDYLQVKYDGKSYNLKKVVKNIETTESENEIITTYYVDDKEVNEDLFENFYRSAIGIECQERKIKLEPEKEAELILIFHSVEGEKITVSYSPWDENFYAVINNDTDFGMVNKMKIKDLVELFLQVVE